MTAPALARVPTRAGVMPGAGCRAVGRGDDDGRCDDGGDQRVSLNETPSSAY
ncbi:hypothetical protein ACF1DY_09825 [Streptomyces albus]